MALPNARQQYLKTQVETASKEQLVVMLFDGIIRFTEQARKAIEEKQIEDSHHALMRAQAIIMELICTVDKDKGGDIANNLLSLHAYAFNCLIVCNMKKEVAQIDEVQKIYRELREAWVNAMDSLGISSNAGKSVAVAPSAPAAASLPGQPAPTGRTLGVASGFGRTSNISAAAAAAAAANAPAAARPASAAAAAAAAPETSGVAPIRPVSLGVAPTQASGYGMGRTAYGAKQPAANNKPVAGFGGGNVTRSIA